MSETLTSGSESIANTKDDNPWGEEYQKSIPPFNGNKEQPASVSEIDREDKAESDDYRYFGEAKLMNVDKIDVSTEHGKLEWLDGTVENRLSVLDVSQYDIIVQNGLYGLDKTSQEEELGTNDDYQYNKLEIDIFRRARKILANLDVDADSNILDAIERKRDGFDKAMDKLEVSSKFHEEAYLNWEAAKRLEFLLSSEIARRDPDYFGQNEVRDSLKDNIEQSEQEVEKTMTMGKLTENGYIIISPNEEKMPSNITKHAEDKLERAKQDAETFELLMDDYLVANNNRASMAIRKEDFIPTIDKFIDDHNFQIIRLMKEATTLDLNTSAYKENQANLGRLRKEYNSAKRLLNRYFS